MVLEIILDYCGCSCSEILVVNITVPYVLGDEYISEYRTLSLLIYQSFFKLKKDIHLKIKKNNYVGYLQNLTIWLQAAALEYVAWPLMKHFHFLQKCRYEHFILNAIIL